MRFYQVILIVSFAVILISSVALYILKISRITLALLLVGFPMALIVAIYGSLAIREEEEEL
jgi:uncharacterized membrane protein YiaA